MASSTSAPTRLSSTCNLSVLSRIPVCVGFLPLRCITIQSGVDFMSSIPRRTILQGAALGLVRLAHGQTAGGRRVLALIGDRYHNPDYIRVALTRVFDGLGVAVDYTIDYDRLSRSL